MSLSPLPDKFKGITDLVLLVDTTGNDDLDKIIIPDIPTVGQILDHNNHNVNYKESSKFFFDNVRRFKGSPYTINITLQFKLGLHDDGSSMNDLLLKANFIQQIGCFKFKFYIFKIVTHQCPDPFVMPALGYFQFLDCIGFRFDTDVIPKRVSENEISNMKYYKHTVNYHIPISILWLREGLQELHLGQKVRLLGSEVIHLKFPNLVNIGFECYDLISCQNWNEMSKYLWQAKEIHLYGTSFEVDLNKDYIEQFPINPYSINYLEKESIQTFQDYIKMSSSPLPKQFKSITDLVLLVDTTENDNLKDFIIPDIPTVGQILYHNNDNIDYKESSKFFFDNVRRFKGSPYTINITLQFKLGLHDDGSSMNDLLLKANFIQQIGCFKFKFYIFKIVTHQCPDPFVMPALGYFQFLDCIGFRFDTDIIPKHVLKVAFGSKG
ncbi:hypothetical protein DFJ63DRAFT_335144 [Scheffersomyces coipomensis]|uniref:uncharacterized protein n=1 Tax=Scheffersomyces coipomensis TaxID=1788519 RepID=UPI00315D6C2B